MIYIIHQRHSRSPPPTPPPDNPVTATTGPPSASARCTVSKAALRHHREWRLIPPPLTLTLTLTLLLPSPPLPSHSPLAPGGDVRCVRTTVAMTTVTTVYRCRSCSGVGRLGAGWRRSGSACQACGGRGHLPRKQHTCRRCAGTGELPAWHGLTSACCPACEGGRFVTEVQLPCR